MAPSQIASLIIAGLAVLGSLGSTMLLSYRVGRLVGSVQSYIDTSATDRQALHKAVGRAEAKVDQHVSWHAGVHP